MRPYGFDFYIQVRYNRNMKPIFYLIAGANGSGKTTLGHELLCAKKDIVFLNTDEIAAKIGDNTGLQAGKIIQEKLDKILAAKKSFVWESTISGNHHLRILEKARKAGFEIVLVYVFLDSVELNIARIKKRVLLGGHDVPEQDIRRRMSRSVKNFSDASKLANQWELYYNGDDNYELVARGVNISKETFAEEIIDDDKYKKFKGLK